MADSGPRNNLGITAVVLGTVALAFSWVLFGGVVLGAGAVGIGIAGRRRVRRGQADNDGATVAGILMGILAIVIGAVLYAFHLFTLVSSPG